MQIFLLLLENQAQDADLQVGRNLSSFLEENSATRSEQGIEENIPWVTILLGEVYVWFIWDNLQRNVKRLKSPGQTATILKDPTHYTRRVFVSSRKSEDLSVCPQNVNIEKENLAWKMEWDKCKGELLFVQKFTKDSSKVLSLPQQEKRKRLHIIKFQPISL